MWGGNNRGQGRGQPRAVYVSPNQGRGQSLDASAKTQPQGQGRATKSSNKTKKDYSFKATTTPITTATDPVTKPMTLFTAGYGGHNTANNFADALVACGVTLLVDIRISPYGSYAKEFNPEALRDTLKSKSVEYMHMIELGNVFKGSAEDDPVLGPHPYIDLLNGAGEVLTRRLRHEMRQTKSACIMCACKDFRVCHRNSVAGFLESFYNYKIIHIGPGGTQIPSPTQNK